MKRIIQNIVRWWLPGHAEQAAQRQYIACVQAARNPFFYTRCAVADDATGRFEMVLLHVALLLKRMRRDAPAMERESLLLVEAFFRDMDHNFREMGVGDLRVGGKVKGCVGVLYGRCAAYDTALSSNTGLEDALKRNVFTHDAAPSSAALAELAQYMRAADGAFAACDDATIREGRIDWPHTR